MPIHRRFAAPASLSFLPFVASLLVVTPACTVTVAPVVAPDSEVPCPGGTPEWRLEIVDQRADVNHANHVDAAVRNSITRSLPGCRWVTGPGPSISLELHRFTVLKEDNWEAAVEWGVLVRDRDGRTLTEFQAESHVSRPNYRGQDNEKASLQQALDEAMRRTLAGLRNLPPVH